MKNIKVYQGHALAEGARLAINKRLWIPGWCLYDQLLWAEEEGRACFRPYTLQEYTQRRLALSFFDNEPIAVVLSGTNLGVVMAYCKPAHRRMGHASSCLKALNIENAKAYEGIRDVSLSFWRKNNVQVISRWT